ncbi:MAG: family 16 glycosylhydrolase [Bacteroidia bacterium]
MYLKYIIYAHLLALPFWANTQTIKDDFEGNGNIGNWKGDNCIIKTDLQNPIKAGINNSDKVLEYNDIGGLYANVRFDLTKNLDLSEESKFTLKIYIPSNTISGSQTNQVSLKLQDGKILEPWSTQSEIIKTLILDQWQTITFDFAKDKFKNLNGGSLPPIKRKDFNRVVIQLNGENNKDSILAYLDDFEHNRTLAASTIYTKLVWADEFDRDGIINSNKWFHQTQLPQNGGWFNGEIQHYTNRTENSVVENGILKIIAKKESFTDQSYTKQYTSARLNSKFAFKYGRVEFRAKLPSGVGTWPAVWMLGKNIDENGAYWDNLGFGKTAWPACGEIDIMEHWGNNQNFVQSAIHTPSSFGNTVNLGGQTISTASSDFHVYILEWTPNKLIFSVDSNIHYTYAPSQKDLKTWPFDEEQYLLINIAIQSNISMSFTQSALEMDYIRVYQENNSNFISSQNFKNQALYPNPVSSHLTINIENNTARSLLVQIYSVDCKLIFSKTCEVNNGQVYINDLADLRPGIYILSYSIGNKNFSYRFIKN